MSYLQKNPVQTPTNGKVFASAIKSSNKPNSTRADLKSSFIFDQAGIEKFKKEIERSKPKNTTRN